MPALVAHRSGGAAVVFRSGVVMLIELVAAGVRVMPKRRRIAGEGELSPASRECGESMVGRGGGGCRAG